MNFMFSLEHRPKTAYLASNIEVRQYKPNQMLKLMEDVFNTPNLTHKQKWQQSGFSDSTNE